MVIWVAINGWKWPFWPLFRSFWGVWKWLQWISHAPKPGDTHQNQVSRTPRTKVTSLAIAWPFEWPKMAEMAILPNDFGHLGHSEVSENGPNGFPMPNNLGIDTKITFLECSEPKLWVWPLYGHLSGHKWPKMAISASLANLRWLKMVSMNFPCPKTLG